jgi:hypothetical protein
MCEPVENLVTTKADVVAYGARVAQFGMSPSEQQVASDLEMTADEVQFYLDFTARNTQESMTFVQISLSGALRNAAAAFRGSRVRGTLPPGFPLPPNIPSLSRLGSGILAILLLLLGIFVIRRRHLAHQA